MPVGMTTSSAPFLVIASGTQSSWSKGWVLRAVEVAALLFCSFQFRCFTKKKDTNYAMPSLTYTINNSQIQERVRKKGRAQFNKSKTGSIVAFKVSFREWDSHPHCIPLFSMWAHQKADCANISCLQHTWYCDSFKSLEIPGLLNTSVPKAMVPFFAKKDISPSLDLVAFILY